MLFKHMSQSKLRDVKKSREIDFDLAIEVIHRVLGERLADKDTRVVHEGVDASEAFDGCRDDLFSHFGIADISRHGYDALIRALLDVARVGNDHITVIAIALRNACTETLRGTGDDCDLLILAHMNSLAFQTLISDAKARSNDQGALFPSGAPVAKARRDT